MNFRESEYLHVKERLDFYRVPGTFHVDDLKLLSVLLQKMDELTAAINRQQHSQFCAESAGRSNAKNEDCHYSQLDRAVRHEMRKTVRENNELHLELISVREQLEASKHCLDKFAIENGDNRAEMAQLLRMRNEREAQLLEELHVAKFKYNELLDFVYEEENLERQYIRRLFNHKKYEFPAVDQKQQTQPQVPSGSNKKPTKESKSRNRIHKSENGPQQQSTDFSQAELLKKLKNREQEISRLTSKMQADGLNLNKVLRTYEEDKNAEKINQLQYRLDLLITENQKIKRELSWSKKTGGRYEALREELTKCYKKIDALKEANAKAERKTKEVKFDSGKSKRKQQRDLKKLKDMKVDIQCKEHQSQKLIEDLRAKVRFYENYFDEARVTGNEQKEQSHSASEEPPSSSGKANSMVYSFGDHSQQHNPLSNKALKSAGSNFEPGATINGRKERIPPNSIKQRSPLYEAEDSLEEKDHESDAQLLRDYREKIKIMTKEFLKKKEEVSLKNCSIENLEKIVESLTKQKEDLLNLLNHRKQAEVADQYCTFNAEQREKIPMDVTSEELNQVTKTLRECSALLEAKEKECEELREGLRMNEKLQSQIARLLNNQQILQQELEKSQEVNKNISLQKSRAELLHKEEEELLRKQIHQLREFSAHRETTHEQQIRQSDSKMNEISDHIAIKDLKLKEMSELQRKQQRELQSLLHKIRQLNDDLDSVESRNQELSIENRVLKERLKQIGFDLDQERQRSLSAINLSECEKDEIISLRRKLAETEEKVIKFVVMLQESEEVIKRLKAEKLETERIRQLSP